MRIVRRLSVAVALTISTLVTATAPTAAASVSVAEHSVPLRTNVGLPKVTTHPLSEWLWGMPSPPALFDSGSAGTRIFVRDLRVGPGSGVGRTTRRDVAVNVSSATATVITSPRPAGESEELLASAGIVSKNAVHGRGERAGAAGAHAP